MWASYINAQKITVLKCDGHRLPNKFGVVVAFVFNTIADDGKNLQRNL